MLLTLITADSSAAANPILFAPVRAFPEALPLQDGDSALYARKHLASAPAFGRAHHGERTEQQQTFQRGCASAPSVAAVSSSQAVSMGQWPGASAAPPQPAPQVGRVGHRGAGKGGGRAGGWGAGGSTTITYGPPQPQKPTTQISLMEALSRHAKAKERQQELKQAEQGSCQQAELRGKQWQGQLAGAAHHSPGCVPEADWVSEQRALEGQPTRLVPKLLTEQATQQQQQQHQAASLRQQLFIAGTQALTQGTPASSFSVQSTWESETAAAATAAGAAGAHQPLIPAKPTLSLPVAQRQRAAAPSAASLRPPSSGPQSLQLLPGSAAVAPSLAPRKPPLAPARAGCRSARAPDGATATAAAKRWAPDLAATPTADIGEPGGKEERRLRLQRLLCDVQDPFERASTGR